VVPGIVKAYDQGGGDKDKEFGFPQSVVELVEPVAVKGRTGGEAGGRTTRHAGSGSGGSARPAASGVRSLVERLDLDDEDRGQILWIFTQTARDKIQQAGEAASRGDVAQATALYREAASAASVAANVAAAARRST
jgi:hypothetical protein